MDSDQVQPLSSVPRDSCQTTMLTQILSSAVLPTLALAATIPSKRENGGDFLSDLSLRTVGARNTLVRRYLFILYRASD